MAESFQFTCPECGKQMMLPAATLGRQGACPSCKQVVTIQPDPSPVDTEVVQPEVVQPQVVQPEVVQPQVVQPEVVQPQVVQPEVVQPQVVQPEVVQPQVVQPQVVQPEIVQPEIVQPEIVQPEIVQPAGIAPPAVSITAQAAVPTQRPAGGKKKVILFGAVGGAGVLLLVVMLLFLMGGGGGGQSSPEAVGQAVFQAFKANKKDAISDLGFYSEARMMLIRDRILAKVEDEAERKQMADEMSDEELDRIIDRWWEEMSEDFNELQKNVGWGRAELVAVLDNEGQREPESDVAEWGGRDNVAMYVIYEVNDRLFAMRLTEIIKFEGNWFLLEENIRVQALSEMANGAAGSNSRFDYALEKYRGSARDRIRAALN